MFCDLVGSTALSTGMDPEDLRDVIASYQRRCSAASRRYEGFVAKYMGDGILVYFGYPRAHEDPGAFVAEDDVFGRQRVVIGDDDELVVELGGRPDLGGIEPGPAEIIDGKDEAERSVRRLSISSMQWRS